MNKVGLLCENVSQYALRMCDKHRSLFEGVGRSDLLVYSWVYFSCTCVGVWWECMGPQSLCQCLWRQGYVCYVGDRGKCGDVVSNGPHIPVWVTPPCFPYCRRVKARAPSGIWATEAISVWVCFRLVSSISSLLLFYSYLCCLRRKLIWVSLNIQRTMAYILCMMLLTVCTTAVYSFFPQCKWYSRQLLSNRLQATCIYPCTNV